MVPTVKVDLKAATKGALVTWLRKHVTRYDRTRVNIVSPGLCGKSTQQSEMFREPADTVQTTFFAVLPRFCLKSMSAISLI